MLDSLDAHDVRVADPFESQHHELDVVISDPLAEFGQIAFQFRCGAEEQLTFQVIDDDERVGGLARNTFAYNPFGCDYELPGFQLGGARYEQQDRQDHTEQHGFVEIDRHTGECSYDHQP